VEREPGEVTRATVATGSDGLNLVATDPGKHLIVVVDLKAEQLDVGSPITGVKKIEPDINVVVIGEVGTSRERLSIPRYLGPFFLVIHLAQRAWSSMAKLKEVAEAKEDYA
jgi:hypothetical protein